MAGKRSDSSGRAINAVVGMAAAVAARKLIIFAWKKITGKEPPEHFEDPQVALRDALVFGIVVGAGMHTARLLAIRAASRRLQGDAEPPAE